MCWKYGLACCLTTGRREGWSQLALDSGNPTTSTPRSDMASKTGFCKEKCLFRNKIWNEVLVLSTWLSPKWSRTGTNGGRLGTGWTGEGFIQLHLVGQGMAKGCALDISWCDGQRCKIGFGGAILVWPVGVGEVMGGLDEVGDCNEVSQAWAGGEELLTLTCPASWDQLDQE